MQANDNYTLFYLIVYLVQIICIDNFSLEIMNDPNLCGTSSSKICCNIRVDPIILWWAYNVIEGQGIVQSSRRRDVDMGIIRIMIHRHQHLTLTSIY